MAGIRRNYSPRFFGRGRLNSGFGIIAPVRFEIRTFENKRAGGSKNGGGRLGLGKVSSLGYGVGSKIDAKSADSDLGPVL